MIALADLVAATGARAQGIIHAERFTGFAFDSRIAQPGQLFVAVVTDTGDGHAYIGEACAAGASGVLCERAPETAPDRATVLVVGDTQQALLDYARHILAERQVEVIGVTGSVGKTSTKEAIASLLARRQPVFRNPGNYNGRFGLPIALGELEPDQRLAVLEMACDGFDEIRQLAEITRPRTGVVTSIGPSHLAYFGSVEQIAREKGRLLEALPPDGLAVLNADDPLVMSLAERTRARRITFGCCAAADYVAKDVRVTAKGTSLVVWAKGERASLVLPLLGAHHAHTALAAAAVGRSYGLAWDEIADGLAALQPLPGRTRLLPGINGATLLDDSYNASPHSALAALQLLADLPARRRLVLLGDMSELGDYAIEGHRLVGRRCAQVADLLVTKGELAALAGAQARQEGLPAEAVQITDSAADAAETLRRELREGDLLLIKGSATARLETVTATLLHNADDIEALPRQHRGWSQVRLQRPGRPTWVEIDLGAVANNVQRLKELVGPEVRLLAVLKADAYGHGAVKMARTVLRHGAAWLGVACLGEALMLREQGIEAPILILGYTPAWQARETVRHDVRATVFSLEVAQALSRAALDLDRPVRVHVKVDSGMGRLGLLPEEALAFVRDIAQLPGLVAEGIFSHLATADEADLSYARWQRERFSALLVALERDGLRPELVHLANSAAALRLPETRYDMVRVGIALYGLNPSAEAPLPPGFRPALTFKSQIAQVKSLPEGAFVGYGRGHRLGRPSRLAVIPVGYADGFRRAPQHWGEVLVRGQRASLVGRVSMDQATIDVTDIPQVRAGDEVVLIGSQGEDRISVDEVAASLGTINYEVVSQILARVPRVV